ncbi:hypothetical protein LEMLEM_LOCUS15207 [Lemmus lemmus]
MEEPRRDKVATTMKMFCLLLLTFGLFSMMARGGNKETTSKPENTNFCLAEGGKCVPHDCIAPQLRLGFCYDGLIYCCKTSGSK